MSIIPLPSTEKIEEDGIVLVGQAEELQVSDQRSFEEAGAFLVAIKGYQARVHAIMDPVVRAADEAHRVAVRQRNLLLTPATEAEGLVKRALATYEQAERDRIAAQQRAQEEIAQRAAHLAQAQQVELLKAAGQETVAAAVAAAPPVVISPPPLPTPKARGVSFRDKWSAVVTDLKALIASVAGGNQPTDLLEPNMETLNSLARTFKQNLSIPGVEVKHERIPAASSK